MKSRFDAQHVNKQEKAEKSYDNSYGTGGDFPLSEVQPLDMKEIGFTPTPDLDELRPTSKRSDIIECYVYSELHEVRQHFIVPKNDPNVNKLLQQHREKYGHEYGQDNANYYFTETDRKPVYLLGHFKGSKGELDEFTAGKQEIEGTGTVTQALAAHPRTYISGTPGAYGNPPTYELDKQEVIKRIKAQNIASEIRDLGEFSKVREAILKNEADRRRS
jgi:hypothetical protein